MNRVDIFEYDRKNREIIVDKINKTGGEIVSWSSFTESNKYVIPDEALSIFVDISSLFYNEDRVASIIPIVEIMVSAVHDSPTPFYIIIDRQYSSYIKDLLFYKIRNIWPLEAFLKTSEDINTNIVDMDETEFNSLFEYLEKNLFGNSKFKVRLKDELKKYRVFNRLGQQPIFSVLLCGEPGIGKTEVARLLHKKIAPNEPMITIHFGNYSAHDALNSLIGSPRGYIGSNKGELPDKLIHSRSKVILIDEFEKATPPVYNFFLQLLEDGKFTDSLGREYDLNKYIIIFTSNATKENATQYFPPELRSRFSYKCIFYTLSNAEKESYVQFKCQQYLSLLQSNNIAVNENLSLVDRVKIDVSKYRNLRDINSEIMRQIADTFYDQIVQSNLRI